MPDEVSEEVVAEESAPDSPSLEAAAVENGEAESAPDETESEDGVPEEAMSEADAPDEATAAADEEAPPPVDTEEELVRLAYIVESIVFAAATPMSVRELTDIIAGPPRSHSRKFGPDGKTIRKALDRLLEDYAPGKRGIVLHEVSGGVQFRTARENAEWVRQVFREKPARLGRAALETLAIVAYRQPATKADIESVRGVDADGAISTLLSKKLIKIVGRKESIGRPLLYGTTPDFLEVFGLKDLRELPSLDEIVPTGVEEEDEQAAGETAAEADDASGEGRRDGQALEDAEAANEPLDVDADAEEEGVDDGPIDDGPTDDGEADPAADGNESGGQLDGDESGGSVAASAEGQEDEPRAEASEDSDGSQDGDEEGSSDEAGEGTGDEAGGEEDAEEDRS